MKIHSKDHWPTLLQEHLKVAKHPLLVVLGPTASGKTAFSIEVAKAICNKEAAGGTPAPTPFAEIVNADSRQLYKHLDIGTAKVTPEEMQGVPHHLFSVLEPSEELTIAKYQEMATIAIDEIFARGCVPILVGGSMLYLSAIIDGLNPLPSVPRILRERLEAAYDVDKGQTLFARLQEIDPATAASFHPNNRPYLVRAMAIYEDTGKPPSSLKKTYECPYDLLLLGMYWERKALTDRIKARTPALLKGGWVKEVMRLREMGCGARTPAMKSHGYREVLSAIEQVEAQGKDPLSIVTDAELIEEIDMKTRQYAKRQMTWWKHDDRIEWISIA